MMVGMRHNEDGVPEDEENFDEAVKAVNTALTDHRIPSDLRQILDHSFTNNLNNEVRCYMHMDVAYKTEH